jgi:acyl-CoA synthetase (AMP-forming)/AMP-acid ligase II
MSTLVDLIRRRGADDPERTAYRYLEDGEGNERRFSYRELDAGARAIAGRLQERGIRQGDRVLLLYPSGLDYIAAFFGCLFAGAVAVPAYAPRAKGPDGRLDAIAKDAGAAVALTTEEVLRVVLQQPAGDFHREIGTWIATDNVDSNVADVWRMPNLDGETLAFLQYTSGSTSTPKGVMVSHGNLMANERMLQVALGQDQDSTWVGWLPMFHDMGLIGNVIQPLYVGAACVLMSPMAFVQEPIRWLRAITKYRGHTSGAPNFAYDLCVAKTTPEEREGLDLSSWSLAFNGSEPVRAETLDRFSRAFEPFGFRRSAFYPCYGLAEATLFVSGPVKSAVPVVRTFETAGLEQRQAISTAEGDEGGRTLVGCGRTWLDQTIVIADPDTSNRCPDDRIGEIWISGPNVAKGYWGREEATTATFRAHLADSGEGPFLRTGDLGFYHRGSLFISGRIKDLIIIRGRNHFPQDIELTVESSHPILRPGCGAAFSVDVDGDERLVVVQEVRRNLKDANLDDVVDAIRRAVSENHELAAHAVVLIKPGRIPKTSSGKIQRHACRQGYVAGALNPLLSSVVSDAATNEVIAVTAEASLLQQTLTVLGSTGSRPVMESHLQHRVDEETTSSGAVAVTGAELGSLSADARLRLARILETDLGVSVPGALVLEATSIEALAADLISLVIGHRESGESGARPGPTRHEVALPLERTYRQGELP